MQAISKLWLRTKRSTLDFVRNGSGLAATEFAVIAPLMLVTFFGAVEFSSAIAVNRKVTLVARTLSDLTSRWQASTTPTNTIKDADLQNVFTASVATMAPYSATPVKATISEIYVDSSGSAKVQWSKAATIGNGATQATLTTSGRNAGDVVTIPNEILINKTYLILAEISYLYTPAVGYVMGKAGVTLSDLAYTRPRQFACIVYSNAPASTCPTP
jgi:Flp pilus assembly protein TadG